MIERHGEKDCVCEKVSGGERDPPLVGGNDSGKGERCRRIGNLSVFLRMRWWGCRLAKLVGSAPWNL